MAVRIKSNIIIASGVNKQPAELEAQTITPSTQNQVIKAGQNVVGDQTILGAANLLAHNIKSGVTIFGVTGTYTGGDWIAPVQTGSDLYIEMAYNVTQDGSNITIE